MERLQQALRVGLGGEIDDHGVGAETEHLVRDRGADVAQRPGDCDGLAGESQVGHVSSSMVVRIVVPASARKSPRSSTPCPGAPLTDISPSANVGRPTATSSYHPWR